MRRKEIWAVLFASCAGLLFCGHLMAQKINEKKCQELQSYFLNYLQGDEIGYAKSEGMKVSAIASATQTVWQAWVKANNSYDEEKLIPMDSLSLGKNGRWKLPEELEPSATMPYYFGFKGGAPAQGYPLYLYLHGSGDKESEWSIGLRLCQFFDDAPSLYFIPQIPNMGDYYRWWQKSKQFAWEKLLRLAFVSGNVNPAKVYLFGISEGGYGSQRLASYYADYLAAAGPMAGGEPLINAPVENCANIGFSFLTGEKDYMFERNVLTGITKQMFDSLQALHPGLYNHRIELVSNMGHGVDYTRTTPWLKLSTRNPYPTYVNWEDFPMDGNYRTGFYNLAVMERSNEDEDARAHYEMNIQGNNVDIKVNLVRYDGCEFSKQWGYPVKYNKVYSPVKTGKFIVYLNNRLVDLSKKVTLHVNGKLLYRGRVKCDMMNMVNSCATFFDPLRLYPAALVVDLEDMSAIDATNE